MKNKRTKVLFFVYGGVGGAERMTVNIGKMLPRDRFEVKFVVCWRKDDICQFIPNDCEVIRIPWHNRYCFPRLRMAKVLLRERPDFVFSSTMSLNILLIQVSNILGLKCIVRNNTMLSRANISLIKKMKKWYPKAYRIVAQQEEMYDEIVNQLSLSREKVVMLHNVIDIDYIDRMIAGVESPYPHDGFINYVCVGRVVEPKGQDILLKAMHILKKREPRAHVYFVGDYDAQSSYFKHLQSIIDKYNLGKSVHFMGYDNNPYRWIKYCDCFVLPSRIEGLPNALIEAQYIGRPCAATECIPIIKRIISNGVNGYTAASEDAADLAKAMENAAKMDEVKMTYMPSTKADYIRLFE